MATINNTGFKTFQATAVALAQFVRVTYDSNGLISVAGATDNWIGVTQEAIAASGYGTVKLRNAPGTMLFKASAAVTCGAKLYPTAAGKVDDAVSTGAPVGYVALEAATADGDIIEAIPAEAVGFSAATAGQAALAAYSAGANGLDSGANMAALHAKVEAIGAALQAVGIWKSAAS